MTRSSNRSGRSLFLTELLWPVLTTSQSNYIYMTCSNRFWSDPFISALGFTYRDILGDHDHEYSSVEFEMNWHDIDMGGTLMAGFFHAWKVLTFDYFYNIGI